MSKQLLAAAILAAVSTGFVIERATAGDGATVVEQSKKRKSKPQGSHDGGLHPTPVLEQKEDEKEKPKGSGSGH